MYISPSNWTISQPRRLLITEKSRENWAKMKLLIVILILLAVMTTASGMGKECLWKNKYTCQHVDELVQEWRNSSASAMKLRLYCTKPSMYPFICVIERLVVLSYHFCYRFLVDPWDVSDLIIYSKDNCVFGLVKMRGHWGILVKSCKPQQNATEYETWYTS